MSGLWPWLTLFGLGASYDDIATDLSVGKKRVTAWLSRIVKDQKENRNKKIFDL